MIHELSAGLFLAGINKAACEEIKLWMLDANAKGRLFHGPDPSQTFHRKGANIDRV